MNTLKNSKPSDFAYMLSRFLSNHMPGERNLSPNTILSYRDTFKLLLAYLRDEKKMPPEKVTLDDIDRRTILDFINWLKSARGSSASTCNQRLGAIHAFLSTFSTKCRKKYTAVRTLFPQGRQKRLNPLSVTSHWME